jgi:prolyl-tRNA synthetase
MAESKGKPGVLTPQAEDFPRWYQDVNQKAELADNGPVRGTMVIRPYGFALWERMQAEVDQRIKAAGADNAYFPLFIPNSYLEKEAEHVEGFSPELAVVTHGGGKELEEPVVVRPTSEMIINSFFAKWIQSYRDLPLLLNQWANVVRWELRPRVWLRTTEFLWQEGHTAHATREEAREYALRVLHDVYLDFMINVLAIPIVAGAKTAGERFAGAINTLTCEAMMRDGKALQMGTSHELGQNFAKAFGTTFLSDEGKEELVWQTSWGVSTRMVGGLIMAHGDDRGLVVPPRLAPIEVVVVLVRDEDGAGEQARLMAEELKDDGLRVHYDDRVETSFGRRATDWELKGVPIRVEVGPRDLAREVVTIARRDTGEKLELPLYDMRPRIEELLDAMQHDMLDRALDERDARIADVATLDEAVEAARTGWAKLPWERVGEAGERRLNEEGLSVRCLQKADGSLPAPDDETDLVAYVARAY